MTRPDALAAQVARNVQHANRLGALYRTAQEQPLDAEALQAQLIEAAACAGPVAAAIRTPAHAEQFCTRLHGLAKLAMQLGEAIKAQPHKRAPAKGGAYD